VFKQQRRFFLVAAMAVGMLFLAGCQPRTTIAEINRDPGRFSGKDVTVAGQVSDAFSVLGKGVFQLDDGTGKIWVYSQDYGVPGNGNQVAVTGRIEQGFAFGGRTFGMILRETEQRK